METAFCLCSGVVLGNTIRIKIAAVVVVLTWPTLSSRVSFICQKHGAALRAPEGNPPQRDGKDRARGSRRLMDGFRCEAAPCSGCLIVNPYPAA